MALQNHPWWTALSEFGHLMWYLFLEPLGILHSNPSTRAEVAGGCLPKIPSVWKTKPSTLQFVKVNHEFLLNTHTGIISRNYEQAILLQWLPSVYWIRSTPNPLWFRSWSTFSNYVTCARNSRLFLLYLYAYNVPHSEYLHFGEFQQTLQDPTQTWNLLWDISEACTVGCFCNTFCASFIKLLWASPPSGQLCWRQRILFLFATQW